MLVIPNTKIYRCKNCHIPMTKGKKCPICGCDEYEGYSWAIEQMSHTPILVGFEGSLKRGE